VGDEMNRGISGGQKKRVTTGILKLRKISCFNNKVTFFMYNKQQYESSKFVRFSQ
jgi:hypothetical protein